MVRVTVKGGLWKNAEDEILKAAVMKYGLNDWERISSLLVQKTAAQCKARWFEWLDPSINKGEWTKHDDERLLHLCKVFPSQWRTISSLVGRTAHQCLERFNIILATGDFAVQTADVAFAESLPSRPDLARLPQEDIAMIDEARARIANIKGRKDRRKERQRAADAVRQASIIQRNRELQAAGLVKKLPGILTKSIQSTVSVHVPEVEESDKITPLTASELAAHFKSAEPRQVKEDRKPSKQAAAFKVKTQSSVAMTDVLDLPPVLEVPPQTSSSRRDHDDVAMLLANLPATSIPPSDGPKPTLVRKRGPEFPVLQEEEPESKRMKTQAAVVGAEVRTDQLPRPGSKKLVAVLRDDSTSSIPFGKEAVKLMIRDAVYKPVLEIQGRPPGVSDVPVEVDESIDSEWMSEAMTLIDAEMKLSKDLLKSLVSAVYDGAKEELTEATEKRVSRMMSQLDVERSKLGKKEAELQERLAPTSERLESVRLEEAKVQEEVVELERQVKLMNMQTEEDVKQLREFIHHWTGVCERERRRMREITSRLVV